MAIYSVYLPFRTCQLLFCVSKPIETYLNSNYAAVSLCPETFPRDSTVRMDKKLNKKLNYKKHSENAETSVTFDLLRWHSYVQPLKVKNNKVIRCLVMGYTLNIWYEVYELDWIRNLVIYSVFMTFALNLCPWSSVKVTDNWLRYEWFFLATGTYNCISILEKINISRSIL